MKSVGVHRNPYSEIRNLLVVWLSLIAFPLQAVAEDPIRLGYVFHVENKSADKDYKLAIGMLVDRVFRSEGINIEMISYETTEQLSEAFWGGALDIVELTPTAYGLLPAEQRSELTLISTMERSEERHLRLVLLAKAGTTFEDLRNKRIAVANHGGWKIGYDWVDLATHEQFGQSLDEFAKEIVHVDYDDPSASVLPTFFGKYDGCQVLRSQYELIAELNPQIKTRLTVVKESDPMLGFLFACRSEFDPQTVEKIRKSASRAHETPEGSHALTLMRCTRLSTVTDKDRSLMEPIAKRFEAMVKERSQRKLALSNETTGDEL